MTGVIVLAVASDPRPDDNNVVAGWVGAVVLVALVIAVVFILRSFTKQLKKVEKAREQGVFGDESAEGPAGDDGADADQTHSPVD